MMSGDENQNLQVLITLFSMNAGQQRQCHIVVKIENESNGGFINTITILVFFHYIQTLQS